LDRRVNGSPLIGSEQADDGFCIKFNACIVEAGWNSTDVQFVGAAGVQGQSGRSERPCLMRDFKAVVGISPAAYARRRV